MQVQCSNTNLESGLNATYVAESRSTFPLMHLKLEKKRVHVYENELAS